MLFFLGSSAAVLIVTLKYAPDSIIGYLFIFMMFIVGFRFAQIVFR